MNYKEYLLKQFDLTEGMRMNYYEEILKTGDFIALSEGKVSFTEVDEELKKALRDVADLNNATNELVQ